MNAQKQDSFSDIWLEMNQLEACLGAASDALCASREDVDLERISGLVLAAKNIADQIARITRMR